MRKQIFAVSFLIFVFLGFSPISFAADTESLLIDKLTGVYLRMAPAEEARLSVGLRLADLHSERGRKAANAEMEKGCSPCKAGKDDRQKALGYYQEALPKVDKGLRPKILLQIGHLQEYLGSESKAIDFYLQAAEHSELETMKADALFSIAEIYYRKRDFANGLKYYAKIKDMSASDQRGLSAYRYSWCLFNLGREKESAESFESILARPELAQNQQFQEEVSRDYATVISRLPYEKARTKKLYDLSPASVRVNNVFYLASEYERLGLTQASLDTWDFLLPVENRPEQRVLAYLHKVDLLVGLDRRDEAVVQYQEAIRYAQLLSDCSSDSCSEVRARVRRTLISWNDREKKNPSEQLVAAYSAYLGFNASEPEMVLWKAQAQAQRKEYVPAAEGFILASDQAVAKAGASDWSGMPFKKEWLETALNGAMANAEESKDAALIDKSLAVYLKLSIERKSEFEVRYQQAHRNYEAGRYSESAEQFKVLALNSKAPNKIREQAADLALDSLVLQKQDASVESLSREFLSQFPQKKAEFNKIAAQSIIKQAAAQAEQNNWQQADLVLARFPVENAERDDLVKYYKNRMITSERLHKIQPAIEMAEKLLATPGIEDRVWVLERRLFYSELQLDFANALKIAQQLAVAGKAVEPLRLAIFAEFARVDSTRYYETALGNTKDLGEREALATELVLRSSDRFKAVQTYRKDLRNSNFITETLFLAYAEKPSEAVRKYVLADAGLTATPFGHAFLRTQLLETFAAQAKKIQTQDFTKSEGAKLARLIRERAALLEQIEKSTNLAVQKQEWTSQILWLDLLAVQNERFYNELMSLPMPAGLSDEEQGAYMNMLAEKARPYLEKATAVKAKLAEFLARNEDFEKLVAQFNAQPLPIREFWRSDMENLKKAASSVAVLAQLDWSKPTSSASLAPKSEVIREVVQAQNEVRINPWAATSVEKLRNLESKAGNKKMVEYLDARLRQLDTVVR